MHGETTRVIQHCMIIFLLGCNQVRALVGLCKLGSSGGTDSSWKPFTDGSTMKLAEACRR